MAILIAEPTSFEQFLHYGLFIGAMFQIVCIMAVVFIPQSQSEKDENEQLSTTQTPVNTKHSVDHTRRGKKDKKKYR